MSHPCLPEVHSFCKGRTQNLRCSNPSLSTQVLGSFSFRRDREQGSAKWCNVDITFLSQLQTDGNHNNLRGLCKAMVQKKSSQCHHDKRQTVLSKPRDRPSRETGYPFFHSVDYHSTVIYRSSSPCAVAHGCSSRSTFVASCIILGRSSWLTFQQSEVCSMHHSFVIGDAYTH